MNKSDKETKRTPIPEQDALPPLDGDEFGNADADELASYLDLQDEDEGFLVLEESFIDGEELFSTDALEGGADVSLLDNRGEASEIHGVELAFDEEEKGWSSEDTDSPVTLDGDWVIEGEDRAEMTDDGGAEGPMGEDVFDLERERRDWQSLEQERENEQDEDEDEILDSMARLGIALPEYDSGAFESIGEIHTSLLFDCTFLGPKDDSVTAATFDSGSPVALGDGLFLLGADGMLHAKAASQQLGRITPTSLCAQDPAIFMGTERGGVVGTWDRGDTYSPLNSWYTQDLPGTVEMLSDRIATSVQLIGQNATAGYRLIIHTDEGQLFASEDTGKSWRGPLLSERCLAVGNVGGTQEIMALMKRARGEHFLATSQDLETWHEQSVPGGVVEDTHNGHLCLAACDDTVVIAARDASMSARISLDNGASWAAVAGIENVTAFAIDPEDSAWMVAATYDPSADMGTVRMSDNSGRTWQTILTADSRDDAIRPISNRRMRHQNRISDLVVDIGRIRQVLVITARGVYLATLARPGAAH